VTRLPRPCLGAPDPVTGRTIPCGVPAVGGRCPACAAAYDAQRRPSPTRRGYDAAYRAERAAVLAPDEDGRRRVCSLQLPGCTHWADTADHVDPVDAGRNRRRGPLRPACKHCNSARGSRPINAVAGESGPRRDVAEPRRSVEDEDEEFWHPDP
jgi:hypothetical protein